MVRWGKLRQPQPAAEGSGIDYQPEPAPETGSKGATTAALEKLQNGNRLDTRESASLQRLIGLLEFSAGQGNMNTLSLSIEAKDQVRAVGRLFGGILTPESDAVAELNTLVSTVRVELGARSSPDSAALDHLGRTLRLVDSLFDENPNMTAIHADFAQ